VQAVVQGLVRAVLQGAAVTNLEGARLALED
jgi:hypothetical protein